MKIGEHSIFTGRAFLGFIGRVPRSVLVKASMRVRAYTRALRYLEEQIRAEQAERQAATGRSVRNQGLRVVRT